MTHPTDAPDASVAPSRSDAADVSPRVVVTPKFGRRLRQLRGLRTRGDVMRTLSATYQLSFSRSSLLQYERGTVLAPDMVVVWALSRLYGTSFEGLAGLLVRERLGLAVKAGDTFGPMILQPTERRVIDVLRRLSKERREFCVEILLSLAPE